jgi:O-antigen/teichoic acid export membrane protein
MRKKQAIKIISLLWVGSILGAGCAFLTQVLLARELGPAAFGVFAATLAIVTLLAPFAGFGVGGFWLKAFGQEGWHAVRWLGGSLKFILLNTALVLASLFAWATLGPHDETTRSLLMVLSGYLLGQVAVELVSAKLQLEERYLALALWQFLPYLLRLLLVAMLTVVMVKFITLHNVAYSFALISIGVFIGGATLLWRMFRGHLALKGHGKPSMNTLPPSTLPGMGQIAAQSWPFGLAVVFNLIYYQSSIILLKYMIGDESAGIYNVAFVIMAAVYILPGVIYQKFLLPKIHRWANHDRQKFYLVYHTGNRVMLVLGLFSMLAIWVLTPWGIPFLFGDSYKGAVFPLSILALAAPIQFVATNVGSTLVTQEHMRRKVWLMAATALINLILNFLLIPSYGINGAALATVISYLVLLYLYIYSAKRYVFITR